MNKRIMIVEDQPDMQFAYKTFLARIPGVEIVSQEESGETALERIDSVKPDLVIIDITLPGMDGFELSSQIRASYPSVKILIVTGHDPDRFYVEAKRAGADFLGGKDNISAVIEHAVGLLT